MSVGRPKIEIDWAQFKKLCYMQCTLSEIAGFFDCSEDTIERRVKEEFDMTFKELYERKSAGGKISLRRKQMQIAEGGHATMLIWLGKQYLGQKDKHEIADSVETEKSREPLTVEERRTLVRLARKQG